MAGDVNSNAGKELDSLTSTAGYFLLIDKPTHSVSGRSCIDLIFCNKPENSECIIYHSLFQTGHQNLIFAKISAIMSLLPSYSREVWDCKNTSVEGMQISKSYASLTAEQLQNILN